ncbi:hypothetical protein ABPG74_013233 [Tetrahymena malaccensis]
MKRVQIQFAFTLIFALIFVKINAYHNSSGSKPTSPDVLNYADFKEIFRDDFNQDKLNTTNWQVGDNLIRPFTNQYQLYTKDNIQIKDGNLIISAQHNPTSHNGKIYEYTGGYLDSNFTTGIKFKYGYTEARIKLPQLVALDSSEPAFWALPDDYSRWPFSVELDIMEYSTVWTKDNKPYVFNTLIYGIRHQDQTNCTIYYRAPPLKLDFTQYHTYGMLWTEKEVTMYIDGIAHFTYVGNDPSNNSQVNCPIVIPNKNFFLILDFAVQQKQAKPEHYPKQMYVDYVRVLKPKQK